MAAEQAVQNPVFIKVLSDGRTRRWLGPSYEGEIRTEQVHNG
jgi:hypothetical protein